MDGNIVFHFDGLAAEKHHLPMNQLGRSLLGIDKIANQGLIFLSTGRLPKVRERFEISVVASEPRPGSFELWAVLQQAPWMLPLVQDFIVTGGVEATYRLISYVLTVAGGRPSEAAMHLDAITQINRDHLAARDRSERQWQETFLALVDRMMPAARDVVKPVGTSATEMAVFVPRKGLSTVVDEPMADAIRSQQNLVVGDMTEMGIALDGFILHNRQLKIAHPTIEGRYLTAEVRDPIFDQTPNPYTEAATLKGRLRVLAKPVYKNDEIYKLYVMSIIKE